MSLSKLTPTLIVLALATAPLGAQVKPPEGLPSIDFGRFLDTATYAPGGVLVRGEEYVVSDFKGNRLLVFSPDQKLGRTIGSIGSEPGDLLRPTNLALGPQGEIYVRELGNQRVQVFGPDGNSKHTTELFGFVGFTVDGKGRILVGEPSNGDLVSVYDLEGELVDTFGELRSVSGLYGEKYAENDERDSTLINRVALAYSPTDDAVYVSFFFVGLVQKYDDEGELLWEKRIQGPHMEQLEHLFLIDEERSGHRYVRTIMDDRAVNYVTSGITVSPDGTQVLVLLPGRVLVSFDSGGTQEGTYLLEAPNAGGDGKEFNPSTIEIGPDGEVLSADPFFNAIWKGSLNEKTPHSDS